MNEIVPAEGGGGGFLAMIERAARDPSIDIDKLDRLLVMRERENARLAEQTFNSEMAAAQAELSPVSTDSANPQTRSKYASYAALDRVVRPVYTRHGFGLTFSTEDAPGELQTRVICDVCHSAGHVKRYRIDMPVDGKGARGNDVMTRTHAMGSGVSYGMRYLLKMIFNLATDSDDDGNAAGRVVRRPAPPAPNMMREPPHDPHTGEVVERDAFGLPQQTDTSEMGMDALMKWDSQLAKDAERGIEALQRAWGTVPAMLKPQLKAALDKRHKPTAQQADEARGG